MWVILPFKVNREDRRSLLSLPLHGKANLRCVPSLGSFDRISVGFMCAQPHSVPCHSLLGYAVLAAGAVWRCGRRRGVPRSQAAGSDHPPVQGKGHRSGDAWAGSSLSDIDI